MEITYMVVVAAVTFGCGMITKMFIDAIPNKYIPVQNIGIGIVSAFVCYFTKIEPNLLQAFMLCCFASCGMGGLYDLKGIVKEYRFIKLRFSFREPFLYVRR